MRRICPDECRHERNFRARKGKRAERRVRMWAQALPTASLYLSVVSVLELEIGTLLVERRDRKQGRFFGPGLRVTFCLHSPDEFWRLTLLSPSDAHRSMCQILAPTGCPHRKNCAGAWHDSCDQECERFSGNRCSRTQPLALLSDHSGWFGI